jgi:hypothetical protein
LPGPYLLAPLIFVCLMTTASAVELQVVDNRLVVWESQDRSLVAWQRELCTLCAKLDIVTTTDQIVIVRESFKDYDGYVVSILSLLDGQLTDSIMLRNFAAAGELMYIGSELVPEHASPIQNTGGWLLLEIKERKFATQKLYPINSPKESELMDPGFMRYIAVAEPLVDGQMAYLLGITRSPSGGQGSFLVFTQLDVSSNRVLFEGRATFDGNVDKLKLVFEQEMIEIFLDEICIISYRLKYRE